VTPVPVSTPPADPALAEIVCHLVETYRPLGTSLLGSRALDDYGR
jgi:hypothetical protein